MKRMILVAVLGLGLVAASYISNGHFAGGGGVEHPDPLVVIPTV
jgi:hypothetical protein